MEDTLQRVFAILIAVIIFFLLPLYIAFEKKDDISYSLALKVTTNFVDNVKNKGYMTKQMYNDYISKLAVTGNSYDIKFEHIAKKYNPVIYSYSDDYKEVKGKFDYNLYKEQFEGPEKKITITTGINAGVYQNLVLAYDLSEEKYTQKQILETLETIDQVITPIYSDDDTTAKNNYIALTNNKIPYISDLYRINPNETMYSMSKGDEFTVVIKNTNTTIASVLFNTLTFGANSGNDTKVYINYGGTIQNESYRENTLSD